MLKLIFILTMLYPFSGLSAQTTGIISIRNSTAPQTFKINSYPIAAPTAEFMNEHGEKTSLKDFRGKVVLVNIWTTSCAQCVIELPMLDRLQKDMGGVKFQVVALSSDLEPFPVLRRFFTNKGIKNLKIYSDPQALFSQAANVKGLPTTFLIDEEGREIGRIRGIAEWDGPKIKAQIRDLIRLAKEKAQKKKEEELKEKARLAAESEAALKIKATNEMQSWFKK